MIKNIIFDLDGTLIDSMYVWQDIWQDFLVNNGIEPSPSLGAVFKTRSFVECNAYFREHHGLTKTADEMISEIIGMVKGKYEKEVPLKPEVYQFLVQEQAKGTGLWILTASELDFVRPALRRLNIEPFFKEVFTCSSLQMSKSSGDIFKAVCERIGGTCADTVVFEDAYHAIKHAKEAGFYVVAVEDESAKEERELIMDISDRYIRHYGELLD